MMKFLLSKHSRSVFIFALLSLFMCMAGAGKVSAKERNPVVKIDNTSYTSSGTEVTLRLWMFNAYYHINIRDYCARFTGDVNLYIDDKEVVKLNNIWPSIANAKNTSPIKVPTDNSIDINIDGINVGTALFNNLQNGQTCPDNSDKTEKLWYTVDLKLSFNKSFSYYGHKITVKGKWQDKSSGSVVEKNVTLDNDINGFVRPVNLKAQSSGDNMVFSWEQQGYNSSASTLGKWVVYKREGDNNVKVGEAAANEHSLSIEKKQYSCSNGYIMTFLPNVCEGEETVCGLTTTIAATGHQINDDDICQMCGHSFFRYQTSDGNKVDISNKYFGAKVVSHEVVDDKCVIEFDAPITKIPEQAFREKNLTGNLVIPNSVTEIGYLAFAGCTGFKGNLTIPNSVTNIGNSAFQECSGFTGKLTISSSVTTIGNMAFYGCSGFTGDLTIPNSVTTIGNYAFANCKGFTEDLTIPNSVTTIGNSAFADCKGFTGDLAISNSVTNIGDRAFFNCSGFTGNLTIPNSVTNIGDRAFFNCSGFTGNLTIPNSVTTIGNSAFYNCYGFTGNLTIPNSVTTIGDWAFENCSGFTGNLTIPNSVTTIGSSAFRYCTGLTGDVSLSKSLEVVGSLSFEYCNKIKTINFQSLPEGISKYLGAQKITVSLSDDSYISNQASRFVNAISYTRTMTGNWGTLVLPYSLKLTGSEPYSLYKIETLTGDELVLSRLEGVVAAGTPCVVKSNSTQSELTFGANNTKLNMAITTTTVGGMTFRGTYWTEEVNSGYVISKDCFWNVEELKKSELVNGVKVYPFRAWLDGTSANAPAQLSMRIDSSATGIDAIDALNDAKAEYYDLSGKRLNAPQRGVNIVRMKSGKTKKIIIK